ncbi:MAG: ankyrin repeat domain-containing protein [Paludibaculum sp.]
MRDEFIRESVWHGSLDRAREILAAHPEIVSMDIYTAALLGDPGAVERCLSQDSASVHAKGGALGWDALTYLCFSRFLRLEPDRGEGFIQAATALLDAGANPNTGFFEASHQPKPEWECALYGAAGVAHHPELTKLLLDRGADPNDGEVAYHAPETLDNRTLRVLVESGKLNQESISLMLARKFNWHDDEGVHWLLDHGADPNWLLWGSRPLHYALRHGTPLHYFEWLLDHGADAMLTDKVGTTSVAEAARRGRADVLELFERRGVAVVLAGDDAFRAACARANEAEARRLAGQDPSLVQRLQSQDPGMLADFAGAANVAAVRLMLELGFDAGLARVEPRWVAGETALHVAAARGCRTVAELLIQRGAPLEARRHGDRTPLCVAFLCLEHQSEWTPNESTLPIAEALVAAGADVEAAGLTLTAAVCLGRNDDIERLAKLAGPAEKQKALAAAAYNARLGAISAALAIGADPNEPNAGLNPTATALHNAVCSGSLAAVKALVEAGARPEARDGSYSATPLAWAEYFAKQGGEGDVEYFQREGQRPKEYAEIARYLRGLMPST